MSSYGSFLAAHRGEIFRNSRGAISRASMKLVGRNYRELLEGARQEMIGELLMTSQGSF